MIKFLKENIIFIVSSVLLVGFLMIAPVFGKTNNQNQINSDQSTPVTVSATTKITKPQAIHYTIHPQADTTTQPKIPTPAIIPTTTLVTIPTSTPTTITTPTQVKKTSVAPRLYNEENEKGDE